MLRRAALLAEVPMDKGLEVNVAGVAVCLVRQGETIRAVGNLCSHEESALAEGFVYEGQIECPLHGSVFDLITGAALSPPAVHGIPVYPVEVQGDEIFVDVDSREHPGRRAPEAGARPREPGRES